MKNKRITATQEGTGQGDAEVMGSKTSLARSVLVVSLTLCQVFCLVEMLA